MVHSSNSSSSSEISNSSSGSGSSITSSSRAIYLMGSYGTMLHAYHAYIQTITISSNTYPGIHHCTSHWSAFL